MHVTRNKKPIIFQYSINNQPLLAVDQATYLGVEIHSTLDWSPHINKITGKANQSLGFLKRNFHSAKPATKSAAYKSLVRPTLEYCSSVWDPYHQKDINKLEKTQRQAARFVTNSYSKVPCTVTNALEDLKWDTLQHRRQINRLVMFYKMAHNHVDINLNNYLTPMYRQSRLHHHMSYIIPYTTLDCYKYSFFPERYLSGTSYHQM